MQLISSGGSATSVMHLGYSHDGYRQLLVAQHLRADGQLLWQRILNTTRYDAERASFAIVGGSVFIAASESAPASPIGQLWELRLADGVTLNSHTIPAIQELQAFGAKTCSLTAESLTRVLCIQPGLAPELRSITGAPSGALNLLAYGTSSDNLRARVVDGINSQFKFASISADGVYSPSSTLAFQSNPGAFPLRTDRVQVLANQEILASARLNDNSNGNALFAAVVALFASDGSRIWQTQINEPQRDYQASTQSALHSLTVERFKKASRLRF